MVNERLRHAMSVTGFIIDDLTQVANVDPKTVRRWLQGTIPHHRHRLKIAKLLRQDESYLWPTGHAGETTATSEIVAAYAHRSDVPPSAWWKLFSQAQEQIDLLGIALLFLPEQHPHFVDMLKEKAQSSCKIRIALAAPDSPTVKMRDEEEHSGTLPARIATALYHFSDILNYPGIDVRFHSTVLYISYARMDNDMFVMPQLYKLHGSKAPLLHLHRLGPDGIFSNFALHFETVWTSTAAQGKPVQS